MKRFDLMKILMLAVVLTVATTGCRSRTKSLTPIPGSGSGMSGRTGTGIVDDAGPKNTYTPGTGTYTPPTTTTIRPPSPPQPPYTGVDTGTKFPPPPHSTGTDLPPGSTTKFPGTGTDTTGRTGTGISAANRGEFDGMVKDAELFKNNTVHFDFDSSVIRDKERGKIEAVAAFLKTAPANKLLVEGHCDERGTEEYNRALGERRALAVREYLVRLGIQGSRIRTISYGFDRPLDPGHNEAAWSKNRRGAFVVLMPRQ